VVEPYLYDIGFSIIDISEHDSEIIRHISDSYASRDGFSFPIR